MPPRKKPKTDAAPDVEPLKPVEMTAAELRRALELKGIKPKSATARPALVRMLQEATAAQGGQVRAHACNQCFSMRYLKKHQLRTSRSQDVTRCLCMCLCSVQR